MRGTDLVFVRHRSLTADAYGDELVLEEHSTLVIAEHRLLIAGSESDVVPQPLVEHLSAPLDDQDVRDLWLAASAVTAVVAGLLAGLSANAPQLAALSAGLFAGSSLAALQAVRLHGLLRDAPPQIGHCLIVGFITAGIMLGSALASSGTRYASDHDVLTGVICLVSSLTGLSGILRGWRAVTAFV